MRNAILAPRKATSYPHRRVNMNDKATPQPSALSRAFRPTPHQPNRSRKEALRRSHKTLTAAVRKFRAFPWGRSRAALELAMDAVQRADLLPVNPGSPVSYTHL